MTLGFRAIPKRFRFSAALRVARLLEPVMARTSFSRQREKEGIDDRRGTAVGVLLNLLTRDGVEFDPAMVVEGEEHFPPPGSGPTLLIAPHAMLCYLITRYFEETRRNPVVISVDRDMRALGTRVPIETLAPSSPRLLLEVRRHFANGRLVAGMIDRADPEPHTAKHRTGRGEIFISHALVRLALRAGAHIVFLAAKLDGARVVCRLSEPSAGARTAEAVIGEFVRFVDPASPAVIRRMPFLDGDEGAAAGAGDLAGGLEGGLDDRAIVG